MRRVQPSANDLGPFPQAFGEKYVLLEHLATGGMSEVFLARQTGAAGFVKQCVIKRLLPHLARDAQFHAMFLDEARLQARLNHSHIAQVFDLGEFDGSFFIAMEYVEGINLEDVIAAVAERGEHLPFNLAARIAASIADALDHAHNAVDESGRPLKLVHRDVTPSNVMVSFEGVAKLLDFGIAKAAERQTQTEVGVVKGKTRYMSPEQARGGLLDGRSDLFSLGTILFEMTTGRNPWSADAPALVTMRLLNEEPTPPSLLVLDYPDELEAIVRHALAKPIGERVASGRVMQNELEHFMQRNGLHATPRDVSAYVTERFPRAAPRRPAIGPPTTLPDTTEVTEMDERSPRPTGPLSLGDAEPMIGEMGGEREFPSSRDRREGGGWLLGVIVVLVLATGATLFLLRGYEMKKEGKGAASLPATVADFPLTPAPVTAAPDPVAPARIATVPRSPTPTIETAAIVAAPKVTQIAPTENVKPDLKKSSHRSAAPRRESSHAPARAVELPHLPPAAE